MTACSRYTVGGAERWYRNLAERLAEAGHDVTYLTLRQWPPGEEPRSPACESSPSARRCRSTSAGGDGSRRRYASAPGCSCICCVTGATTTLSTRRRSRTSPCSRQGQCGRLHRYELIADWHEFWSAEYWREYLGAAGRLGVPSSAAARGCPSGRSASPSCTHGACVRRGCAARSSCSKASTTGRSSRERREPVESCVVFAGRLIPEKRAATVVPAVALAAARVPGPPRSHLWRRA